jgi:hypothetical protein
MRKPVPFLFSTAQLDIEARRLSHRLHGILILSVALSGCSLYRNQDREDFDQQASLQVNATSAWICTSPRSQLCWDLERGSWTLVRIEASSRANPASAQPLDLD